MSAAFNRDDPVLVETELGQMSGKVVEARPATDRDEEIVVVLTDPGEGQGGGQLLTLYASKCAANPAASNRPGGAE